MSLDGGRRGFMGASTAIDLGQIRTPIRWDRLKPARAARMVWMMVLLLAVKDRATEVRYAPQLGMHALRYVVDGIEHELVPPPEWLGPSMFDELRSLTRTRGLRAGLARLLRRAASWLDRPIPTEDFLVLRVDGLDLGATVAIRSADVAKEVVVRLDPDAKSSLQAWRLMRRLYGEDAFDPPLDGDDGSAPNDQST